MASLVAAEATEALMVGVCGYIVYDTTVTDCHLLSMVTVYGPSVIIIISHPLSLFSKTSGLIAYNLCVDILLFIL